VDRLGQINILFNFETCITCQFIMYTRIKRHGRVSAKVYARDRLCIYTRAGELQASEIIRSQ